MELYRWADIKRAWRWISVQAMALSIVVQGAWQSLDADLRSNLPTYLGPTISIALLVLGILGRFVKQPPKDESDAS